ncbi:MAG: hypothetical protein ACP5OG_04515 [Candidatus Nanoarchaeia archaeon]
MVQDKSEIEKQAREILDKFASALESIDSKESESFVDREEFERKEVDNKSINLDFKARMLENAPTKDEDFIIAEKGNWK